MKAPYVAQVDDFMIGLDPFVLNVVIISVANFGVLALTVTACTLSKNRYLIQRNFFGINFWIRGINRALK